MDISGTESRRPPGRSRTWASSVVAELEIQEGLQVNLHLLTLALCSQVCGAILPTHPTMTDALALLRQCSSSMRQALGKLASMTGTENGLAGLPEEVQKLFFSHWSAGL
jgi:hypothetical protein